MAPQKSDANMVLVSSKHSLILKYILILLMVSHIAVAQTTTDFTFKELEQTIQKTAQYVQEKEERIASIKSLLDHENEQLTDIQKYQINNNLIDEYWAYSFDSTLSYISRNIELAEEIGNQTWIGKNKLNLALLLASSGRYKESQDILSRLKKTDLSPSLIIDYYNCYRKIYSDLDYFAFSTDTRSDYTQIYKAYTDSVASILDKDDDEYLYLQEWELLDRGKFKECLAINSLRLSKSKIATKEYSYITFQRSMIYEQMGDRQMEQNYLIRSAISDIMACRKDNASLAKLASRKYEEGDLERAASYIQYSFDDATFYNSKLRFFEIAHSLSRIMEAYQRDSEKKNKALRTFSIILSGLAVVLLILFYFVFGQNRKLQKAKNDIYEINEQYKKLNGSLEETMSELKISYDDLTEANRIKELYIGSFMSICSDLIDKLDRYRLLVNKMLRAKKYQHLFDLTNTRSSIEDEIKTFYNTFDKTFITIFPSFVEDINELFDEDQQIELGNNEILNTELRILALMRLGIKDSTRIAQLLRYSVNTIYNYRTKIKNKAKGSREEIEQRILKIGSHKNFKEINP